MKTQQGGSCSWENVNVNCNTEFPFQEGPDYCGTNVWAKSGSKYSSISGSRNRVRDQMELRMSDGTQIYYSKDNNFHDQFLDDQSTCPHGAAHSQIEKRMVHKRGQKIDQCISEGGDVDACHHMHTIHWALIETEEEKAKLQKAEKAASAPHNLGECAIEVQEAYDACIQDGESALDALNKCALKKDCQCHPPPQADAAMKAQMELLFGAGSGDELGNWCNRNLNPNALIEHSHAKSLEEAKQGRCNRPWPKGRAPEHCDNLEEIDGVEPLVFMQKRMEKLGLKAL